MSTKNILVTLPMLKTQQAELERQVVGGKDEYRFFYGPLNRNLPKEMTDEGMVEATPDIPSDIHGVIGDCKPAIAKQYYDTLEFLQVASAGYDSHVKPGVLSPDCIFCNASGGYHDIVSEQLLALTFAACRQMDVTCANQRDHRWIHPGPMKAINQSVCVVLGLGDIGLAYARKMKALGAYTIGLRKHEKDKPECLDEQYTIDHLDEVLPRADILCLILPGGPETDGLMNGERLASMKKNSVIVNAGRGTILDETALLKLLNEGWFYGLGLDVASKEPLPAEDPLWDAPRTVITPHTGGSWQRETQETIFNICKENLHAWATGGEFTHLIRH